SQNVLNLTISIKGTHLQTLDTSCIPHSHTPHNRLSTGYMTIIEYFGRINRIRNAENSGVMRWMKASVKHD
ncbi:hypothetical protein DMA11_16750, partial [Marinilabiliaceae bacterium JC017]